MSTSKKLFLVKYHHGNLGNDLKKYAINIIKDKDVTQLNLRDLAAKCGVSPTAVYRHYNNKEHLLVAIAEDGFNELQKAMLEVKDPDKLQKIGIVYIHFALQHPVEFQLMFGSILTNAKNKYPSLVAARNEAYQILYAQVEDDIQKKLIVGDTNSLARAAWAAVHGTAMLLLDDQFIIQKNEIIDSSQIALEITTILGKGIFVKIE